MRYNAKWRNWLIWRRRVSQNKIGENRKYLIESGCSKDDMLLKKVLEIRDERRGRKLRFKGNVISEPVVKIVLAIWLLRLN